jgi:hypothetical protein
MTVLSQPSPVKRLLRKRALANDEQQHIRHEISTQSWDEGAIERFMNDVRTTGFAYELACKATLYLFAQDEDIMSIVNDINALLTWLGVPPSFKVNLWLRDDPRMLEKDTWPDRKTVNGGFAIPKSNEIFVYRKEEYNRVVIHETIHALGWDWQMPEKPLPCWGFDSTDVLSPHLFEAWTELYAEWLYCGFYNMSWAKQREWQEYQATQILARVKGRWTENTNVFAYYVLKAALAPHIEFLWAFGNGQNEEERNHVLCRLVEPELMRLNTLSDSVVPEQMSLRMSRE